MMPQDLGEIFNPSRHACGFYPPDFVGRQSCLTDGQKRLYERLVRFAGRNGECFPKLETLASELGKSVSQIKRDLKKLESFRLVSHRRGNGRTSNRYDFHRHPWFDGAPASHQIDHARAHPPVEGSLASYQAVGEGSRATPQTEPSCKLHSSAEPSPMVSLARLMAHPRPTNSEHEFQTEKSSSSSSEIQPPSKQANPTTMTNEFPLQAEPAWPSEDIAQALEALDQTRGRRRLPPATTALTDEILPHMSDLDDLRLWLAFSESLLCGADTWGLYITDARRWPGRRVRAIAQQARSTATPVAVPDEVEVAEANQLIAAPSCPETEVVTPPPPRCSTCDNSGVVGGFPNAAEWCDCENGRRKKELDPNYVSDFNVRTARTRVRAS